MDVRPRNFKGVWSISSLRKGVPSAKACVDIVGACSCGSFFAVSRGVFIVVGTPNQGVWPISIGT